MIRTNVMENYNFKQIVETRESEREINHPMMYYKSMGEYAEAVQSYMHHFKHVKILIYEEFFNNIDQNIVGVWEFLNVDKNPDIDFKQKWNVKNFQWRSKGLQKLVLSKKENIEELINYYNDDVKRLSKIINKDLSFWLVSENIRWK
jgi:hypothetical protein